LLKYILAIVLLFVLCMLRVLAQDAMGVGI